MSRLRSLLLGILFVVVVFTLAGCAADSPEPADQDPLSGTEAPQGGATTDGSGAGGTDDGASAEDGVTSAKVGGIAAIGGWSVVVREVEWGSGNDDVSVPGGMTRLEAEVELRNTNGVSTSVSPAEWSVADAAGTSYDVLPSSRPEKQGQRTIGAGENEDVNVNFAVPSRSDEYVLRFAPAGGDEVLEVPLR